MAGSRMALSAGGAWAFNDRGRCRAGWRYIERYREFMAKMLFETATNTYTSDKVIGQGGAGTVFSVLDPEGGRYALKRLNPASSLKRRRFKNELSFCQQEQHPNVIRVLDSGVVFEAKETLPFYV